MVILLLHFKNSGYSASFGYLFLERLQLSNLKESDLLQILFCLLLPTPSFHISVALRTLPTYTSQAFRASQCFSPISIFPSFGLRGGRGGPLHGSAFVQVQQYYCVDNLGVRITTSKFTKQMSPFDIVDYFTNIRDIKYSSIKVRCVLDHESGEK